MDLKLVEWPQVAEGACHTSRNDDHSVEHIENTNRETDGISVDPLAPHNVNKDGHVAHIREHKQKSEPEQQPRTTTHYRCSAASRTRRNRARHEPKN